MTEQTMIDLALQERFAAAVMVDTKDIVFDPIFRPCCEENLCGQYGVNYTCPPDCGSPEEMEARVRAHKRALVLQTIWEIPDPSDNAATNRRKRPTTPPSCGWPSSSGRQASPAFWWVPAAAPCAPPAI